MNEAASSTEGTKPVNTVTAQGVLALVEQVARELHPHKAAAAQLDSDLERDLGIDSLGRVELLALIEQAFGVSLPDQALARVDTPRHLMSAISAASGAPAPARAPVVERLVLAESETPARAQTLLEVLDWHALRHPERPHILLLDENGKPETITYAALKAGALAVAAGLRSRGVEPGQSVALMLPTSRDYFFSFFGSLFAGAVPVPIYPPARISAMADHLRRHSGILSNAQARALVTVSEARLPARLLGLQVESLRLVTTAEELAHAPGPPSHKAAATDVALLQYTSGSTGQPKGVVLSHANLLANIRAMGRTVQATPSDVFVSWLPLYHDMGLIGAWFGSMYHAIPLVVMSPMAFLARPVRWLRAISDFRGTISAAPNFAFELCLSRIQERDLEGLDLSSLRMLFSGAEPVSPDTLNNFQRRFARHGLRPEALAPVYGLAECSVGLALPPPGRGPLIDRIKRSEFVRTGRAVPAEPDEMDALRFVACGQPLPGHEIRVVDASGRELAERQQGRLEFKGPSATSGYLRNPEATGQLFKGDWLDSGDLAYIAGGDIYVAGRVKDIVIRAGRNIYPHELEQAIGDLPGIRKGCVAVFGSPDPSSGTERLIVMAETREQDPEIRSRLRTAINGATLDLIGIAPDDVVLAPPHTVLKTSSGKIRRAASREAYEHGGRPLPLWREIARVLVTGWLAQLRRAANLAADLGYAYYAWAIFGLLAPATWLITILLPREEWSWAVSSRAARVFLRLIGIRVFVQGLENLPADGRCVAVANHASYADGIVLLAALAQPFSFVAKRELADRIISRLFLRHIGAQFVERFDPQRGIEDVHQVVRSVQAGRNPIFSRRAPSIACRAWGRFAWEHSWSPPRQDSRLCRLRYAARARFCARATGCHAGARFPLRSAARYPHRPAAGMQRLRYAMRLGRKSCAIAGSRIYYQRRSGLFFYAGLRFKKCQASGVTGTR